MSAKRKSWREKLADSKGFPKVAKIDCTKSKRWGEGTFVIPAPLEVDAVMKKVGRGKLITIDAIRKLLAKKHGTLASTHVPNGLLNACRRFFGAWEDICRVAEIDHLDHVPRGYWTRERVIEELRARASKDQPLTTHALGKSIASALWRHFGGLEPALAAAGIKR